MLLYCQQSAAALSAAAAAATCVCRTSLYTYMYYALQYGLCLALFVYGCAVHAILLCLRNLTLSNNQGNTEDFFLLLHPLPSHGVGKYHINEAIITSIRYETQ